jgi:hypothetical protein
MLGSRLAADPDSPAPFTIKLDAIHHGYDGKTCWVHPRAGVIPGPKPSVVLTMQKLILTGSDLFLPLNEMHSDDLGQTWSEPREQTDALGRHTDPDGTIVGVCDFTPKWHAVSGKLLGTGHTVRYRNDKVVLDAPRGTPWSVYDPARHEWSPWRQLEMPEGDKFWNAGAGCVQRVDLPDGDILLPIYYRSRAQKADRVTVLRCGFDGDKLVYKEHGTELALKSGRGYAEPSIAHFGNRFYLTLRQDDAGSVTSSADGLHFDEPRRWCWDDGTELGNYNTQQHWVTHHDALWLVYTRAGANNDHVFRHRAPLFIAQVDPQKLRAIRATERILIPERGARLGNFGVTDVSANETWVTDAEWMQTWGPHYIMPPDNAYGSDNSVYAARIQWQTPNSDWDKH